VARPREIKVYEPVSGEDVVFRREPRKALNRTVQLFCALSLL
jgi:hypothetical protein